MFPQARGVRTFILSVREKALAQEFVGQNTRLWEAPNCLAHFKINKTVQGMFREIVLINRPLRE